MARSAGTRSITIHDVARLAGVSAATVSKVLNDGPGVAPRTRDHVRTTMERVGYRPNSIARSLKAHRTSTIGLVTDDLHGDNTMAMMHGVEEVAGEAGFGVMLCNSYGERDRERGQLEMLMDKRVDGIILMSGRRTEERAGPALSLGSLPTVFLFRYTLDLPVPGIVPDDHQGGRIATEHLLALGRRRIALVSGPRRFETSTLRAEGYREALTSAGVPIDPRLEVVGETWYEDTGYAAAHRLMSLPEPPDAIFCGRDNIAVGVLDALRERRLSIPEDVAVVGYHDLPGSAYQRPPLTSVARPLLDMGRLAGAMLIDAIDGRPHPPDIVRMPCRLVQRSSCGATRTG